MKKLNYLILASLLIGLAVFTSCKDDESEATGTISVQVTGLPTGANASIKIEGNNFLQDVTGNISLEVPVGTYDVLIAATDHNGNRYVSAESIVTIIVTENVTTSVPVAYAEFSSVRGIVGTWVSKGTDVALLLVNLFKVDSIVATFRENQTYTVLQYAGGATAALTLSGTYTQTKSNTGNIWTITVNQSAPAALTSAGIFEVTATAAPNAMKYEIAQTSPDIGAVPATPAGGFGSTNAGVFGTLNVQNYKRRGF